MPKLNVKRRYTSEYPTLAFDRDGRTVLFEAYNDGGKIGIGVEQGLLGEEMPETLFDLSFVNACKLQAFLTTVLSKGSVNPTKLSDWNEDEKQV